MNILKNETNCAYGYFNLRSKNHAIKIEKVNYHLLRNASFGIVNFGSTESSSWPFFDGRKVSYHLAKTIT
ncbi:hypothetical protein BpHYR1_007730 [Brachionus plicatilis]|uniref:Uncharacterized protein n=1 Tax=Brachionus plicatilis TaxID=10195 RepID=A0A3M7Q491_BRAPC|nr:hypothetical protein BpHYR1_007730 [Brachionus plicatilis]